MSRSHSAPKNLFLFVGLGLGVWGFLIYANALSGSFQFDDNFTIVNNPAIRQWQHLGFLFKSFNTRFFTGLTFALNYQLGGLNVFSFHLVNILIHILNALSVFLFIQLLGTTPVLKKDLPADKRNILAIAAAFIFLAHPLQTQAVTYITQRAASLATFFYLTTLILYLRFRLTGQKIFLWTASIMMILGMFTKETTATIPVMLAAIEIFFFDNTKKKWKEQIKILLPFFAAMVIIPVTLLFDREQISTLNLGEQFRSIHLDPRNLMTEINVLRTYLRLFILPVNQNLDYDYPITPNINLPTVLSFILLAAVLTTGIYLYRKNRLASFCIFWFFITISVEFAVHALVGIDFLFEHCLYLPMVGFAILLAIVLKELFKAQRTLIISVAVIVLVFSFLTHQRNKVWHDPFLLWHDAAKKSPNKYRPYANLGVAYRRAGDYDKAIIYHHKALSLGGIPDKSRAQIYVNLGFAYGDKGMSAQEVAYCQKALKLNPYLVQAYNNMSYAYFRLGRFDEAIASGEKAVSLSPYSAECFNNLGIAYAGKGELKKALELFEIALKLEPGHPNATQNRNAALKLLTSAH